MEGFRGNFIFFRFFLRRVILGRFSVGRKLGFSLFFVLVFWRSKIREGW